MFIPNNSVYLRSLRSSRKRCFLVLKGALPRYQYLKGAASEGVSAIFNLLDDFVFWHYANSSPDNLSPITVR